MGSHLALTTYSEKYINPDHILDENTTNITVQALVLLSLDYCNSILLG